MAVYNDEGQINANVFLLKLKNEKFQNIKSLPHSL